jgi:hypothetical protein
MCYWALFHKRPVSTRVITSFKICISRTNCRVDRFALQMPVDARQHGQRVRAPSAHRISAASPKTPQHSNDPCHDPQRQLPELAAKGEAASALPHFATSTRSSGRTAERHGESAWLVTLRPPSGVSLAFRRPILAERSISISI